MATSEVLVTSKCGRVLTLSNGAYAVGIASLAAILALGTVDVLWGALVSAVVCGWSELNGRCGMSHIGALTPLRSWNDSSVWLKATSAYTLGGLLSAASVGALLGSSSQLVGTQSDWLYPASLVACFILLIRELGWIRFPLPQIARQTVREWAHQFGFVTAALMWGTHIGFGFLTVIKHGGFFAVMLGCISLGPRQGSYLMAAYWVGRTLPMWLAPYLSAKPDDGAWMVEAVRAQPEVYLRIAVVGLAGLAVLFIRLSGIL